MTEATLSAQRTSRETASTPGNLPLIFGAEEVIGAMPDADVLELQAQLTANPTDAYLYLWLGLAAKARAQWQAAIDAFSHVVEHGCAHWRIGWYIAQTAKQAGQIQLVDQACAAVLKANPQFWFARELPKHARGYYSQIDQDKVVEQFFAKFPPRSKVFVEVGAFDGVHYSNVRRLHEKYGWTGISFEPVSKNYRKLSAAYAGTPVKCVNAAVSTADSELEINVSTYPHLPDWGSDVATLGEADTARWEKEFGAKWTKEKVPVRRLTRLLEENGIDEFDFISIDTEGHDLEVLKSVDFARYRPQLIIIEYGEHKAEIAEILRQQNYGVLQDNGQDFIAGSKVPPKPRAAKPAGVAKPEPSKNGELIASFFKHQTPRVKQLLEVGEGTPHARHLQENLGWTSASEIHAADFVSFGSAQAALSTLNLAQAQKLQTQMIAVDYGTQRADVLGLLAQWGYSPYSDDGKVLLAARFRPSGNTTGDLVTRNFTGLSGQPAYNEIEVEFQRNLHGWLRKSADKIERIVIVGGCLGLEVRQFLAIYPQAEIHVFEPSKRNYPKLASAYAGDARVKCHPFAVSDRKGRATFHEGSMLGVGSLLPACDKSDADAWVPFESQEAFEVELTTLDEFEPLRGKSIDLLWCDVQGAELQVLRGGRETLARCHSIFLEVANTKITYKGQCRFVELDRACDAAGFYLAAIGLCPSGNGTGNAAWLRMPASRVATNTAAGGEQGEWVTIAGDELGAALKRLQPHLLKLNYLPLDRPVRRGRLTPIELVTPERFDLMAKLIYARHWQLGAETSWARELYHEHIRAFSDGACKEGDGSKDNIDDYFQSFHALLDDVAANGFDAERTLVPIARGNVLIDGAHRAAACLLHGRAVDVLAFDREDARFDYGFFQRKGLSEAACDAIALEYCRMRPDTFVVTVFPSAQGRDTELREILASHGRIVYVKNVQLNRQGAHNLIREIYDGEPWVGNWHNGFAGVKGKMEPCFRAEGPVRVFVFQAASLEIVKAVKTKIRALYAIENHSVHINDTHAQTLHLAQLFLNANSIHFLNHAKPRFFERFVRHLGQYRAWLRAGNKNLEHFCIDGSAVMAAYGLREAQDLDVLHYDAADFASVMPGVNSHNPDAHHHTTTRDDIVFNPANHFYAFGLKFASLDVIRRLKAKRNEGKDQKDVALIDACQGTPAVSVKKAAYEFTTDWFKTHEPHWNAFLKPWAAKRSALRILEVGSFEGRSACWLLDNLMSDLRSRLTCVDPWPERSSVRVFTEDMEGAYQRFQRNIAASGKADQVDVRREASHTALKTLPPASFDLIYLDGDHGADAVAEDTRLALALLKPGGLLLWDDYYWSTEVKLGVDRACAEAGITVKKLGENGSYSKPAPAGWTEAVTSKIVALIPARNEAARLPFCLRALKPYVDAVVYLDDCSDDDSVRVVERLAIECKVEHIIRKAKWHRDEPGDRNALLAAGRKIGGTHFVVLDADEAFTANCAQNDYLRRLILSLRAGESLALSWIQLWRSVDQYRFDQSQWTYASKAFAFCDDGLATYKSGFIHTQRIPTGLSGKTIPVINYVHGVLHFQFVDWTNLQIKQAWYRCMERVRQPQCPVAEINARYAPSEDESDINLANAPRDWFDDSLKLDASVFSIRDTRRVREVLDWFGQHGVAHFGSLDVWRVNWADFSDDAELAAEIRRQASRVAPQKRHALSLAARQHMLVANECVSRGDLKGCRVAVQQALAESPEHPEILASMGNLHVAAGENAEARKRFEASLAVEPNQPRVWTQLAATQKRLKNVSGFMTALQKALSLEPASIEALRQLAEHHSERGRHADAVGAYRQLTQLAPQDIPLLAQFGRALLLSGETAEAEKVFGEVLAKSPNHAGAKEALARLKPKSRREHAKVAPALHR